MKHRKWVSTPEVKSDMARQRDNYYSHNPICLGGCVWSQGVQSQWIGHVYIHMFWLALDKTAGYDGVMSLCFRLGSKLWFCYPLVTWPWIRSLNLVKSQLPSGGKWRAWTHQTRTFLHTLHVPALGGRFILVSSWVLFLNSLDPISVIPGSYFCIPWILFLTYVWPKASAPFLVLLVSRLPSCETCISQGSSRKHMAHSNKDNPRWFIKGLSTKAYGRCREDTALLCSSDPKGEKDREGHSEESCDSEIKEIKNQNMHFFLLKSYWGSICEKPNSTQE